MKILLWKSGALGDVLMTTPLVRQLRAAFPTAQIDYLTGHGCVAIVASNPHISRVIGFDADILYRAQVRRAWSIVPYLRGYDAIFILDKHWIFSVLAWLSRVPRRIGFLRRLRDGLLNTVRVPYGAVKHEILYYLDLAKAFGVDVDVTDVALQLAGSIPADLPPGAYVVLVNSGGMNPYEQSVVRRMPADLFRQLVASFSGRATAVFVGAQAEHAYYEQFASAGTLNLCGKISLQQVWYVLEKAQAVYSTDCGLMHMAGALNRKLTGIFGPTHPERKCPPGARWAWKDQRLYDSAYEVSGRLPRNRYFENLSLSDIVDNPAETPLQHGHGFANP